MTSGELAVRTASAPKTVQRALDVLSSKGQVLLVDRERRLYVAGETFAALQARALALLQSFHDRAPLEDALHREELRQRLSPDLDPRLLGRLVQALVERGTVESIGEGLRLKGRGGASHWTRRPHGPRRWRRSPRVRSRRRRSRRSGECCRSPSSAWRGCCRGPSPTTPW
jgi:hypothetical protein